MPSTPSPVVMGANPGSSLRNAAPSHAAWVRQPVGAGTRERSVSPRAHACLPPDGVLGDNSTHPAIALVRDAISASSEAQIAQRGVVVRPAAEWPVKLAFAFGDRHVVDAGDSPAHQPVGIELA